MNTELRDLKREAKSLGINTNNFSVTRDSMGEYAVCQYGRCLAEGYNITECRIYAINQLIEECF